MLIAKNENFQYEVPWDDNPVSIWLRVYRNGDQIIVLMTQKSQHGTTTGTEFLLQNILDKLRAGYDMTPADYDRITFVEHYEAGSFNTSETFDFARPIFDVDGKIFRIIWSPTSRTEVEEMLGHRIECDEKSIKEFDSLNSFLATVKNEDLVWLNDLMEKLAI